MDYALVENGIVTNIIWLYEGNAGDFPHAVKMDGYPVSIGDQYVDGKFYRNGECLQTYDEERIMQELENAYEEGVNSAYD